MASPPQGWWTCQKYRVWNSPYTAPRRCGGCDEHRYEDGDERNNVHSDILRPIPYRKFVYPPAISAPKVLFGEVSGRKHSLRVTISNSSTPRPVHITPTNDRKSPGLQSGVAVTGSSSPQKSQLPASVPSATKNGEHENSIQNNAKSSDASTAAAVPERRSHVPSSSAEHNPKDTQWKYVLPDSMPISEANGSGILGDEVQSSVLITRANMDGPKPISTDADTLLDSVEVRSFASQLKIPISRDMPRNRIARGSYAVDNDFVFVETTSIASQDAAAASAKASVQDARPLDLKFGPDAEMRRTQASKTGVTLDPSAASPLDPEFEIPLEDTYSSVSTGLSRSPSVISLDASAFSSLISGSSLSSVGDSQGYTEQLAKRLLEDGVLQHLCVAAVDRIPREQFEKELRRSLRQLYLDLRKGATSIRERQAAKFVGKRARNAAHIVCDEMNTTRELLTKRHAAAPRAWDPSEDSDSSEDEDEVADIQEARLLYFDLKLS